MSVQDHPHYPDEQRKLDTTTKYIRDEIDGNNPVEVHAAYPWSASALWQHKTANIEELKRVQPEPYIGRVDWLCDGASEPETFYIGKFAILGQNIFSWRDTLAADLFYQYETTREDGTLLLAREFSITQAQLKAINDKYVDDSLRETLGASRFSDALLIDLLNQHRSGALHDIIATIQARQYRIIRAPHNQILIVQGVPGSGKTSIALHRMAYLLYQPSLNFEPRNVLVLGPNRVFMQYIASILPDLGEQEVPHRTFHEWVLQTLDLDNLAYETQEQALESLLDPQLATAQRSLRYRNDYNKSSLTMAVLLDRYVELLADEVLANKTTLICTFSTSIRQDLGNQIRSVPFTIEAERSLESLREIVHATQAIPLNQRREEVERRLTTSILTEMQRNLDRQMGERGFGAEARSDRALTQKISEQVEQQVHRYFDGWSLQNTGVIYRRLLRSPELLRQVGAGLLTAWELELLHQAAPKAGTKFQFSDLGALLYLHVRLNGVERVYDHMVLDEAQDLTPLLFKTLSLHCRNGSMTVLGDIDQGIYAHHGIGAWDNLTAAAGTTTHITETLRESYRSTREIIELANMVLQRMGMAEEHLAIPINRRGVPPSLYEQSSRLELAQRVMQLVLQSQASGHVSIAIMCKTLVECRAFARALSETEKLDSIQQLETPDDRYQGGIVLLPVYLAKGLEFDVVIIADADATTYPPDDLHARLLYVGLTRAAHQLYICWSGQITPLLAKEPASDRLRSPLHEHLAPQPVTIAEYATSHIDQPADWCVERLAASEKLHLFEGGRIDAVLLAAMLHSTKQARESEDVVIAPLSEQVRTQILAHIATISQNDNGDQQQLFSLTQLVFSLLNNHLRALDLIVADQDEVQVTRSSTL